MRKGKMDQEALRYHSEGRPGENRGRTDEALSHAARPVAGLFARRRSTVPRNRS